MNDKNAHSYTEAGYYENTEAANFTTEEQLKKEEIYLNLGKLSDGEIKEIYKKIKNSDQNIHTQTERDLVNGIVTHCYWFLFFDGNAWSQNETPLAGKTELTYPEFIKLFEGGESKETDENGRPMIYWGGKATCKEVLQVENNEWIKSIAISHQKQMSSTHPHAIIGTIEDAIIEALETFKSNQ